METIACKCSECDSVRQVKPTPKGAPRTPKGWKNRGNSTYICGKCWTSCRRIRATDFMVGAIVEGGTWSEFLTACRKAWHQAKCVLNWATNTLWASDVQRTPDMEKMPPMQAVYLYGIANEKGLHQDVGATSRQSLFQLADQRYRKRRWDVIWNGEAIANARNDQPFPLPSQNYKLLRGPDNQMRVQFTLGGTRWLIELNGGAMMGSRKADFQALINGDAEGGQMDLIETKVSKGARRKSGEQSDAVSGQKDTIGVKVKISGWFPKSPIKDLSGTLVVRTDQQAFIVATPDDGRRESWTLHGQHVARSVSRHRQWLQVQSDDRKFERRKPPRKASRYNRGTGRRCDNHQDVMKNWIHESTRQLTNVASRLRMACVMFSKDETGFESFPWHVWESTLANKLDAVGIAYVGSKKDKPKSSGEVPPKTP